MKQTFIFSLIVIIFIIAFFGTLVGSVHYYNYYGNPLTEKRFSGIITSESANYKSNGKYIYVVVDDKYKIISIAKNHSIVSDPLLDPANPIMYKSIHTVNIGDKVEVLGKRIRKNVYSIDGDDRYFIKTSGQ